MHPRCIRVVLDAVIGLAGQWLDIRRAVPGSPGGLGDVVLGRDRREKVKASPWLPWFALGGLLMVAYVWSRPLPLSASRIDHLPAAGTAYQSVEIPLQGAEVDFFRGARVVKRLYRTADHSTFVVLGIDGSGNRHAVHDPLFCFRGAGWVQQAAEVVPLARGEGKRVRFVRGTEEWEAIYWFTDGQSQHGSPLRAWLQSAARRLTRGYSGPEPVLVVVQPGETTRIPWSSASRWFSSLLEW
jgi:hypothetical protein